MPKVASHVSPKGPFGAKEPLIIGLFCPKGVFRRKMTYEDKAGTLCVQQPVLI